MNRQTGFSLVELMVAITLATIMSLGVLEIFVNQTGNITHETQRDLSSQQANHAFDTISSLLRQANKASLSINYPSGSQLNAEDQPQVSNDQIIVDFILPEGFNVWPNDKAPYTNNAIRLAWNNSATDTSNKIQMATAGTLEALNGAPLKDIAGTNTGDLARIINLDVWPMQDPRTPQASHTAKGDAGYLLRVTARTGLKDMSYNNPDDSNSDLQQYRTHTVSGIIFPRN